MPGRDQEHARQKSRPTLAGQAVGECDVVGRRGPVVGAGVEVEGRSRILGAGPWLASRLQRSGTYNEQPICYVALSSQKNYCSLYLMGTFRSASKLEQLKAAFKATGKKLDKAKCWVHFELPDDWPLDAIGKLISTNSTEKWIEMYVQSRLMTKAGQAQMAKQGAPLVGKVAAKRVDKKRQRYTFPA